MVSYAELCQAIERWQRSQGRESPFESSLSQAMWRKFIEHNVAATGFQFPADSALEDLGAASEHYDAPAAAHSEAPDYQAQHPDQEQAEFEYSQEPVDLCEPEPPNDVNYAATGS